MPNDAERCRVLCELIDREPEDSPRAELYTRLLWQILDKQLFPVSKDLRWRPVHSRTVAASA